MLPNKTIRAAGVAAAIAGALVMASCQTGSRMGGSGASGSGLAYMTQVRDTASLPSLRPDPRLEKAAIRQAGYMAAANRMAHDTGWRRDFATRMAQDGVAAPAAENLAHGRMDMGKVFQMWMDSTGHRKNMLDPRFGRYGLAHATASDGRRYWALVLGK